MIKPFRKLFLTTTVVLLTAVAAQAQSRIATVNLGTVFKGYYMTKESTTALQETEKEMKKELEAVFDALKKQELNCRKLLEESNDQAVSGEERAKRKKAIEPKLKELKENETSFNDLKARNEADIKQKMGRMMDKVLADIKRVVESKAKSGGFAYVIDSSAKSNNQTELLLYTNGENDLTQIVLDQLNAAAPLDTSKK